MPQIFHPNSGFFISGTNLDTTDRIKWGDVDIDLEALQIIGSTGISGALPASIQTSEVFVIDSDGSASSIGEQIVRLKEVDQITVSSFSPAVGSFEDVITVNGSNFYRITDVKFGTKSATFNVISPTEIEAAVPASAGQAKIKVSSSTRSGEAGTTFHVGESSDFFHSRPQINSLSLKSSPAGSSIQIFGYSLTSVQSVKFEGLPEVSPINVTDSSLTVTVPEGATRGNIILLTKDGESITGQNQESVFNHFAQIHSVTPSGVAGGGEASINGSNFFASTLAESNGFVKVNFGGVDTESFKITNSTLITGTVPNNVATGINLVRLYSEKNELYESGKNIYISGKAPEISGVSPLFGITGKVIGITGKNLGSINKLTVSRTDDTGVFYDISGSGITESASQNRIEIAIPSGFQTGFASGEGRMYLDFKASGKFGVSNETESGFLLLGRPIVQDVIGNDSIAKEPSTTGVISGLNLLRGGRIDIIDSVTSGEISSVSVTGVEMNESSGQFVKNFFNFPTSFDTTGIKMRIVNAGGVSNYSETISVHKKPQFSGFTPLSGVAGTRVVASGYFSGFKEGGIQLNGVTVSDLALTGDNATGATFLAPSGASSNFFTLTTSGGFDESNKKFSLMPDSAVITGLSPKAFSPLSYSVFSAEQKIDVLGTNLNLVDQIIFYDSNGANVNQNTFLSKSENRISLNLPNGAFSGSLRAKDRFNRTTTGSSIFNLAVFSGASGFYGAFDQELSFSGDYFSGLNATFKNEFGENVSGTRVSSSNITGDIFSFNSKVPREVVASPILITGLGNDNLLQTPQTFFPLPTISGVSGSSNLNLNQEVEITGINSLGGYASGDAVIGITGDGNNTFYTIDSFSKITGSDGKPSSIFTFSIEETFTGSGQFYIMSPWENYNSGGFDFSTSKTNENINKIITSDFYNIVYPAPAISGISTSKINQNISGFISGENLKPVTGVFMSGSGNGTTTGTSNFENITNRLIKFSFPFNTSRESGFLVVQSDRGIATSELSGGLVQTIPPIAITSFSPLEGITGSTVNLVGSGFLDASVVNFETVDHSGNASFSINSDSGIAVTVPQFSISEGQDAAITVKGLLTDQSLSNTRFTVIHDAPAIQFNVVSGRTAPEVGTSRSAIFTIVETIDGVDYYVTKMINPDGREIRMNTERV